MRAATWGPSVVGFGSVELDDKVSAFEYLHVKVVDGRLSVIDTLVFDVGETKGGG